MQSPPSAAEDQQPSPYRSPAANKFWDVFGHPEEEPTQLLRGLDDEEGADSDSRPPSAHSIDSNDLDRIGMDADVLHERVMQVLLIAPHLRASEHNAMILEWLVRIQEAVLEQQSATSSTSDLEEGEDESSEEQSDTEPQVRSRLHSDAASFGFLADVPMRSLKSLSERIQARELGPNTTVVWQRDLVDNYYFIMKGSCAVVAQSGEKSGVGGPFHAVQVCVDADDGAVSMGERLFYTPENAPFDHTSVHPMSGEQDEDGQFLYWYQLFTNESELRLLHEGSGFGELAMMELVRLNRDYYKFLREAQVADTQSARMVFYRESKTSPPVRNATVRTITPTVLLVLDEVCFDLCQIYDQQSSKNNFIVDFFKHSMAHTPFAKLRPSSLNQLALSCEKVCFFAADQFACDDGERLDFKSSGEEATESVRINSKYLFQQFGSPDYVYVVVDGYAESLVHMPPSVVHPPNLYTPRTRAKALTHKQEQQHAPEWLDALQRYFFVVAALQHSLSVCQSVINRDLSSVESDVQDTIHTATPGTAADDGESGDEKDRAPTSRSSNFASADYYASLLIKNLFRYWDAQKKGAGRGDATVHISSEWSKDPWFVQMRRYMNTRSSDMHRMVRKWLATCAAVRNRAMHGGGGGVVAGGTVPVGGEGGRRSSTSVNDDGARRSVARQSALDESSRGSVKHEAVTSMQKRMVVFQNVVKTLSTTDEFHHNWVAKYAESNMQRTTFPDMSVWNGTNDCEWPHRHMFGNPFVNDMISHKYVDARKRSVRAALVTGSLPDCGVRYIPTDLPLPLPPLLCAVMHTLARKQTEMSAVAAWQITNSATKKAALVRPARPLVPGEPFNTDAVQLPEHAALLAAVQPHTGLLDVLTLIAYANPSILPHVPSFLWDPAAEWCRSFTPRKYTRTSRTSHSQTMGLPNRSQPLRQALLDRLQGGRGRMQRFRVAQATNSVGSGTPVDPGFSKAPLTSYHVDPSTGQRRVVNHYRRVRIKNSSSYTATESIVKNAKVNTVKRVKVTVPHHPIRMTTRPTSAPSSASAASQLSPSTRTSPHSGGLTEVKLCTLGPGSIIGLHEVLFQSKARPRSVRILRNNCADAGNGTTGRLPDLVAYRIPAHMFRSAITASAQSLHDFRLYAAQHEMRDLAKVLKALELCKVRELDRLGFEARAVKKASRGNVDEHSAPADCSDSEEEQDTEEAVTVSVVPARRKFLASQVASGGEASQGTFITQMEGEATPSVHGGVHASAPGGGHSTTMVPRVHVRRRGASQRRTHSPSLRTPDTHALPPSALSPAAASLPRQTAARNVAKSPFSPQKRVRRSVRRRLQRTLRRADRRIASALRVIEGSDEIVHHNPFQSNLTAASGKAPTTLRTLGETKQRTVSPRVQPAPHELYSWARMPPTGVLQPRSPMPPFRRNDGRSVTLPRSDNNECTYRQFRLAQSFRGRSPEARRTNLAMLKEELEAIGGYLRRAKDEDTRKLKRLYDLRGVK